MKRIWVSAFLFVFLLAFGQLSARANWSDHFSSPQIIGPGTSVTSGQVLDTLTPEFAFKGVGSVSFIYIFEDNSPLTLAEEVSQKRNPIFVCRALSTSLKIPGGVLKPGNSYYWYVKSIHNLGTKSECAKTSETLYFATTNDAK
jgi:hypothetical protein